MKTSNWFARLCAAVVLIMAPLSLLGAINDDIARELKLTKYVEPIFPDMARLAGLGEGHVALAISRTPDGVPVDILVLKATDSLLAASAIEAVKEWRFQPSTDPADLVARTVRIGFRLGGVVVYPFGKKHIDEVLGAVNDLKLREPVKVPRIQALAQTPKALTQTMPAYPSSLQKRAIEGEAKVRFYVDEQGHVRLPEVIEATTPEFGDAAIAAVSQWRYEPPLDGGRRIVASDHWAFQFRANN
jgi:TonB family protein